MIIDAQDATRAIRSATRRARNIRGILVAGHGSDSYDKRGKTKATRALDKAIIAEQLTEEDNYKAVEYGWVLDAYWEDDEKPWKGGWFVDGIYDNLEDLEARVKILQDNEVPVVWCYREIDDWDRHYPSLGWR